MQDSPILLIGNRCQNISGLLINAISSIECFITVTGHDDFIKIGAAILADYFNLLAIMSGIYAQNTFALNGDFTFVKSGATSLLTYSREPP